MITFNELPLVKASVLEIVDQLDELIIVDSDSVDGTKDILSDLSREYGHVKWYIKRQERCRDRDVFNNNSYRVGNVGFDEVAKRNYAISLCTGDYIFTKDVDELMVFDLNLKDIVNMGFDVYSQTLVDVIDHDKVVNPVHYGPFASHRLFSNTNSHRYIDTGKNGIDCMLDASGSRDFANLYKVFHYKIAANKRAYNYYQTLPYYVWDSNRLPKFHDQFIKICEEIRSKQ